MIEEIIKKFSSDEAEQPSPWKRHRVQSQSVNGPPVTGRREFQYAISQ